VKSDYVVYRSAPTWFLANQACVLLGISSISQGNMPRPSASCQLPHLNSCQVQQILFDVVNFAAWQKEIVLPIHLVKFRCGC